MKTRRTGEWIEEFEKVGIPCGPVNTIDRVAGDPQVVARNMIIDVNHPTAGDFKLVNSPLNFSRTPCTVERAAPELGEHTGEVLMQRLGLTNVEIDNLKNQGII